MAFNNYNHPWCEFFSTIFFLGYDFKKCQWISADVRVQKHELKCLKIFMSSWNLSHEKKEAVSGWMLSNMFKEVPKDIK